MYITEAEWLRGSDPGPMIQHLKDRTSPRQARLFACACCRRVWRLFSNERHKQAVEAAERFADNQIDAKQLQHAYACAGGENEWPSPQSLLDTATLAVLYTVLPPAALRAGLVSAAWVYAADAVRYEAFSLALAAGIRRLSSGPRDAERAAQAHLLRCIFGNPWRAVAMASSWRSSDVVAVGQAIYDERAFDRMPILADALEDAGCTDAAILEHCREQAPHVRGCWLVDLILGKK